MRSKCNDKFDRVSDLLVVIFPENDGASTGYSMIAAGPNADRIKLHKGTPGSSRTLVDTETFIGSNSYQFLLGSSRIKLVMIGVNAPCLKEFF